MKWLQNVIVGILFFGALVILGYFTIISDSGPFARRGLKMVVFFENTEGIKEGSRVTVLGVPMGRISSIDLVAIDEKEEPVKSDSPERVGQKVAVTIDLKYPVSFYSNYYITLKNESIISGKVLSIDPGFFKDPRSGKLYERLPVMVMTDEELKEKDMTALDYFLARQKADQTAVNLIGESTGDPLAGLSELISENRADVRQTIKNIESITNKINTGDGTLGQLVNNDELHRNANTLVTDAQVVVREMRESLEDTREQAPVNSFIRAALTAF